MRSVCTIGIPLAFVTIITDKRVDSLPFVLWRQCCYNRNPVTSIHSVLSDEISVISEVGVISRSMRK